MELVAERVVYFHFTILVKITIFYVLALREAQDITIHIKPLQLLLEEIEQTDFGDVSYKIN